MKDNNKEFNKDIKVNLDNEEFEKNTDVKAEETVDYSAIIDGLKTERDEYKAKLEEANNRYSELEKEVISLREFKQSKDLEERQKAEKVIFDEYDSELIDNEAYSKLKEEKDKYSLNELEEKCLIIYGKYMKNKHNKKSNKKENKEFSMDNSDVQINNSNLGAWSCFEKYTNQK